MNDLTKKSNIKLTDIKTNTIVVEKYMESIRQYLVSENWSKESIEKAMKIPMGVPEEIFKINWVK